MDRRKVFFSLLSCAFCLLECHAKYLISANDSVSIRNCDLEGVRNASQLNADREEVIIHGCHIDELPNALFIRFEKLRILEITESQLLAISDFAFNGLRSLQVLNLSRNNLTVVKTWSDRALESLHILDLRRNAIATLHKYAFKHYPGLLKLNLAVNHISEIPDELFRFVPSLKYLNVGKNNLKSIYSYTFKHLHKLIHLELKHNQIEFIAADAFVGSTHLKVLHLQVQLSDQIGNIDMRSVTFNENYFRLCRKIKSVHLTRTWCRTCHGSITSTCRTTYWKCWTTIPSPKMKSWSCWICRITTWRNLRKTLSKAWKFSRFVWTKGFWLKCEVTGFEFM